MQLIWTLKINPTKLDAILFRKTVNEIPFTTVQELYNFKVTLNLNHDQFEIPVKNLLFILKYASITYSA